MWNGTSKVSRLHSSTLLRLKRMQSESARDTPLVLRDIEGRSTSEAAEIMELGEAAFKSRLHRGRMALRTLLGPRMATS